MQLGVHRVAVRERADDARHGVELDAHLVRVRARVRARARVRVRVRASRANPSPNPNQVRARGRPAPEGFLLPRATCWPRAAATG